METKPTTNEPAAPIVPVDFARKRRVPLKCLGKGVYAYPRPCSKCGVPVDPDQRRCPKCDAIAPDVVFWERPFVDGRQTQRKLKSTTLRNAQLECGKNRSDQALAKIGRAVDPYDRKRVTTVGELLEFYEASGCPQRNEKPRTGKQLADEKRSVGHLNRHLGKLPWTKLNLEDLRIYHSKRIGEIEAAGAARGPGHRSVEIEERALSAAFRWAVRNERKTGVSANPVAHDRSSHCPTETVRHCRDVMPANADELHALARALFESPRSEVLAWQLLFEAMIGQRTAEILKLRVDAAAAYEAGYIGSGHLYLHRSRTSKGTFPYVDVHAALRDCIAAHRNWHQERFPESSWYFPSPCGAGAEAVRPDALTHALRRVTEAMKVPHRTSHGLRSYYVNVLRSQGKSDAEIALRIGHKTGGKLIVQVYGEILPYKLTWLPEDGEPAWSIWTPGRKAGPAQMELGL
jgi:integrase